MMKDLFDTEVSVYQQGGMSQVWRLRRFLFLDDRQRIVEQYRQAYQTMTEEEQQRQRRYYHPTRFMRLPSCTISGVFKTNYSPHLLLKHSGLIGINIHPHDNPQRDMAQVKEQLKSVDEILYISLSADGEGLLLIVPLGHPDKHRSQVRQLKADFSGMGIAIADHWNFESRLCPLTYDPDPYINVNATPYDKTDGRSNI